MTGKENKSFSINIIENGPLQVTGKFKLIGSDNKEVTVSGEIFLCRCGNSVNKPFCDGSHKKNRFRE